jgi:hypothetical protein
VTALHRLCCLLLIACSWFFPAIALAETQRVDVSVLAGMPPALAWEKLQDFSVAHYYVPNLSRTEIVSTQVTGMGAHRRVYDMQGDFLEETIIEWQDGVGFVIQLHKGEDPMVPFERAEFSYRLSPASDDETLITLSMTIELPLGAFGAKLGEWFILPVVEDNLVQVAAGMKQYYETGIPATDEDRERLAGLVEVIPASQQ